MVAKASPVFGLYGAGGFGREVMPFVRDSLQQYYPKDAGAEIELYFIETKPTQTSVNGVKLISEEDFIALPATKFFNIAIADAQAREVMAKRCLNLTPCSLRSPMTTVYEPTMIGEGAILCPYTTIMPNAKIGKFFHCNIYSYVAHDCVIGDYVTFAPNVHCNGNVHIGHHAYIGTGAIIRPGSHDAPLTIGDGAVIGMGAVVTKNVAPHTIVVGNPARVMQKS